MTTEHGSAARSAEERARLVAEAIHSNEMEGVPVPDDTRADADLYITGEITADDLVARAKARYPRA